MPSAELSRLRVAQAARVPVSVERIVDLLEGDEAAENLSAAEVEDHLDEWVKEGVIERLPGGRYVHAALFANDMERRVVANLEQRPRTVNVLQEVLRRDDNVGNVPTDALEDTLASLEQRGLVVNMGEYEDPAELVDAITDHAEASTMHPESQAIVAERLAHKARKWQLKGSQWIITERALDALKVT